ncbi:MAG: cysteine-rich KTR domain-containing protein [Flintibacter sp.]|uniref:cysteine-rich KTR domain-containing protein n=1 Tax=Flintibacter sp. TaxID=1918624 RepID=UPI002D7EE772|nr:cysteine-rich KTR domain-containing protein [Flintibacter sp.]MCI7158207.1 cysteine-rich KTR domain-containing protein [Flintibacter sp.]MCI7659624.1 cysteine-rich KTR domain-containing protein [Flintibacter sp.]
MQTDVRCGKLVIRNGWVICPVCGKGKLLLIRSDTTARNLPRKCKRCGQETLVNIEAPEPASTVTSA